MSQLLVAVMNNTPDSIFIWNSETASNHATIESQQIGVIQGGHGHWNIPDCSAEKYFAAHHMEIRTAEEGVVLYSFWDDDKANYILQMCNKSNYGQRKTMPGASDLGNNANVMVQVNKDGLYSVAAQVLGS